MKTDQEIVEEMRQKYGYVAPTREIVMDVISIQRKENLVAIDKLLITYPYHEGLLELKKQIEGDKAKESFG